MITLRLRHIILFTIIILLTACQFEDDQLCPDNNKVGASYINLTIAVTDGSGRGTRADDNIPLSGEDGNGREAGFERENAVTGITLILYRDDTGINTIITESNNPVLDFVRFYPVSRVANSTASQGTSYDAGTAHTSHPNQLEAAYTTGPQPIGKPGALSLDLNATYHAIVVANYDLTTGTQALTEKTSTLNDVRDLVLTKIASGSYTDAASDVVNFVMSSEEDNTLTLSTVTGTNLDGTPHTLGQDILYDLTNQPLIIERLAARIDFWSKGGTYDATTYTTPGYVYRPWKSTDTTEPTSTDRFVVTRITPFNLNAGTEYLLKRTNDTQKYLASETGSNYVIDPTTSTKTGTSTPSTFVNALFGIAASTDLSANDYCHKIADMHSLASASSTIDGNENIVICYPMENTLPDNSPLYYYATGIAIEGDYYIGNNTTDATKREHRIYFGYIRHQGDAEAYDALLPTQLDATLKTSDQKPMNFGIVRNNIYRIYIDKVIEKTVEAPRLKIKIEEEKWRHVDNPIIYI